MGPRKASGRPHPHAAIATVSDPPAHLAFPNVDNAPSNAICRKLGFELLGAFEFEFPKGQRLTCNDWRLDLRG
jgi:hypothetical protein